MIRVQMHPHVDDLQPNPTAGISRVVKKYFEHLPDFGIEMAAKGSDAIDLVAIHAGAVSEPPHDIPLVSHCHGLYFTADSHMDRWTHGVNQSVIETIRHASSVSVPSNWVAEIFKRDMHFNPVVIPHGVDWEEWQGGEDLGYVLWNKNRASDACDPTPVNELAMRAPKTRILTTYAAPNPRPNIRITGTVGYTEMRDMVMKCSVYLATTKETFGIGTLEAMAAGKAILGFDYGGTSDLIKHGYSGYLAAPDDYDDLARGLEYCQKHAKSLGRNASLVAQHYTWKLSAKEVANQYARTMEMELDPYEVAVVIPMYNKAATILRAVRSAITQTFKPAMIIVVNNNSTDDYAEQIRIAQLEALEAGISFIFANCEAQGVAHARNLGIWRVEECSLICCLDADDEILPDFLEQCRLALIGDVSLGIAYTKMEVVNTRGERSVSGWPGVYNFDKTLRSQNQVPTCCLFRRICWERTGGYRQRYAPGGAGSEDADFWLRIGLLGWGGVLATSEPLFRYYLGGTVTGNPNYREVDWRGDKGWLDSRALPFAATATPDNGLSHPVRQYDEPVVSVIIPVGPGHVQTVIDAIDSVEGQTFRQWELIVVDDGLYEDEDRSLWKRLKNAFPFIRWYATPNAPRGAGYARNAGASLAKAPFLLFLDADDWLKPSALEDMIAAYNEHPESIIYSDYIGHAYIADQLVLARLKQADRLIEYNEKTTEAIVRYSAFDFDCERAQRQPEVGKDPYIWSVVSSLVPTAWHREIGGFDESMQSWEDYDYWVHLAKKGKCFHRVAKPLLEYRFFTGKRRTLANPYESGESGRQLSTHLLEYMRTKYERMENMPCSGCGGGRRSSPPPVMMSVHSKSEETMATASSNDMVDVELIDGNIGDHLISFSGQSYGYRASGDKFKMLLAHAKLDRRVRILETQSAPTVTKRRASATLPPPPDAGGSEPPVVDPLRELAGGGNAKPADVTISAANAFDLTTLWGINADRAEMLKKIGVRSPSGVVALQQAQLMKMFGMSELTARRVISEAQKAVDELEAAETKSRV